jgi:hypothetical protein
MTLKEKILSDNYLEDYENPITDYQADVIVERADDYAIEFAEWCNSEEAEDLILDLILVGELDKKPTTKQLLEQFKKEKGL